MLTRCRRVGTSCADSGTARNVAGLTPGPTRMRVPRGSSISIPSVGGGADDAVCIRSGVTTTGTSCGGAARAQACPYRLRHVKTMLVFTSYCRATTDTDAPGADAAATISRFSASGQDLCRRLTRSLVSITDFVDTSFDLPLKAGSLSQINSNRQAAFTGGIVRQGNWRRVVDESSIQERSSDPPWPRVMRRRPRGRRRSVDRGGRRPAIEPRNRNSGAPTLLS
jgi:hypothetical protein